MIERPTLGVVIVAYQSADVIGACLDSLLASTGVDLRIVVVDNQSTDDTVAIVRARAARTFFAEGGIGQASPSGAFLTLLRAPVNGGYAYGVNRGLELLRADSALDLFWVLNPDCTVRPGTAAAFARAGADGGFALMGGRVVFEDAPDTIQTDGGRVLGWTGRCRSVHAGRAASATNLPDAGTLDYISGASLVATRTFIDRAGLMPEDYFLYYEEVDWAFRRGTLPLRLAPDAVTLHRGGTAIGSATHGRRASPFAEYFNYRNRMRFVRRHMPSRLLPALGFALAKAGSLLMKGAVAEAAAIARAVLGWPPSRAVRMRLQGRAAAIAFDGATP